MWRKIVDRLASSACLLLSQLLTAEEPDPVEPLLLTAFEQDSPDVGWYVRKTIM